MEITRELRLAGGGLVDVLGAGFAAGGGGFAALRDLDGSTLAGGGGGAGVRVGRWEGARDGGTLWAFFR